MTQKFYTFYEKKSFYVNIITFLEIQGYKNMDKDLNLQYYITNQHVTSILNFIIKYHHYYF